MIEENKLKIHLCAGAIYLKDYINIDIEGYVIDDLNNTIADKFDENNQIVDTIEVVPNPNETTLDNYFKYPFIKNEQTRVKLKRNFIIDKQMNVLEKWDFEDNSVDEIVMISCIEHFNPKTELPHIFNEINRVMKKNGKLIIDFPDIKKQVEQFIDSDPEWCMELIYCNHRHQYAIHHWGFTPKSFPKWLGEDNWNYLFCDNDNFIVQHDYPMLGCYAVRK
jgi:predicted SAM-dependent methyltransferase